MTKEEKKMVKTAVRNYMDRLISQANDAPVGISGRIWEEIEKYKKILVVINLD